MPKTAATGSRTHELHGVPPKKQENPVDRYGNVIRHACRDRPQWSETRLFSFPVGDKYLRVR
jgi:hypothetical protein